MKRITALALVLCASVSNAATIPFGIQTDINTSVLTDNGWVLNFQSGWGSHSAHDYELFEGVALDEFVFIGALDTGTNNIALGAAILYSDLLNYTSGNNTNDYNGASWYFREDYSMGFAAIGETVNLYSADISADSGVTSKLSWHMHNHHTAGYRVGNYITNSDSQFEKVVFRTSEATDVPEPTSLALLTLGLAGIGFTRKQIQA